VLARWFTDGFARTDPEVVERRRQNLLQTPPEGYAGCCEALAGLDLRSSLSDVRAPTLVISGREDPATPPEHGRLIADRIAGARFEIVDDAAHLANLQQPEVVGELIERHLLAS
jgi:3-oxoadipate enol-lactonase